MDVQGDRELTLKAVTVTVSLCTYYTGHLTEVQNDNRSINTHQQH